MSAIFGCPFEEEGVKNCAETFPTSLKLRDHVSLMHMGYTPFICKLCFCPSPSVQQLTLHAKVMHAGDPQMKWVGNNWWFCLRWYSVLYWAAPQCNDWSGRWVNVIQFFLLLLYNWLQSQAYFFSQMSYCGDEEKEDALTSMMNSVTATTSSSNDGQQTTARGKLIRQEAFVLFRLGYVYFCYFSSDSINWYQNAFC